MQFRLRISQLTCIVSVWGVKLYSLTHSLSVMQKTT